MSQTEQTEPCGWTESVPLYLMGNLNAKEQLGMEQHLLDGCSVCQGELQSVEPTVLSMDQLANGDAQPRAELKQRLMQRIRSEEQAGSEAPADTSTDSTQVWRNWTQGQSDMAGLSPGIVTRQASADDADWSNTAVPGVQVRKLCVNQADRSVTMLVRMEAGTSYPRHRHAGLEQCFVLSGDVQLEGRELLQGDFQSAAPGSIHEVQSTLNGCTLLIVSSTEDELLD